jgi:predicted transcriptional regulator
MDKETIARVCHEANRALCESFGDHSQVPWESAPNWQKKAILEGVEFHLSGEHNPEESHENWVRQKQEDGWVLGKTKDPSKKTHPCLVPYDQLPPMQKAKDAIIANVVRSLQDQLTA